MSNSLRNSLEIKIKITYRNNILLFQFLLHVTYNAVYETSCFYYTYYREYQWKSIEWRKGMRIQCSKRWFNETTWTGNEIPRYSSTVVFRTEICYDSACRTYNICYKGGLNERIRDGNEPFYLLHVFCLSNFLLFSFLLHSSLF